MLRQNVRSAGCASEQLVPGELDMSMIMTQQLCFHPCSLMARILQQQSSIRTLHTTYKRYLRHLMLTPDVTLL